ncbi:hypothetical protein Tco_0231659 [Tanacetum coccineum]
MGGRFTLGIVDTQNTSKKDQKETPFSLTYGPEAIILTVKSNVAKDDRGRTKEVTKRKESKEVALIEESYYQNELRRYHSKRSNHSTYKGFTTETSVGGDIRLETGTEDGVAL